MLQWDRMVLRQRLLRMSWSVFRGILLTGLCFVILYPLLYMVSCAVRSPEDMNDPTVLWIPRHVTWSVLAETIEVLDYWKTLAVTVLLNVGSALVQVGSCAVTGYGFARFRFRGRGLLFGVVLLMILVPQQVIAIPQYMLLRDFGPFNLINHPLSLYLPAATGNGIRAGLMIFIFRQFFRGIPSALEDAACLDGCSAWRTFWQVMLPNAKSAVLTVFLFSVVWYWNDFYVSSVFFTQNQTMALQMKNFSTLLKQTIFHGAEVSLREQVVWMEAGALLAIAPVLLLYLCLQRRFTQGIAHAGLTG